MNCRSLWSFTLFVAECTPGRFNAQQGRTACTDCEFDLLSLICCSFICWVCCRYLPTDFSNHKLRRLRYWAIWIGGWYASVCSVLGWEVHRCGCKHNLYFVRDWQACKLSTRIVRNYCDVDGWQMVSTSATECVDCAVGRIQPSNGQLHCPLCPLGKYQPNTGTTVCLDCTGTEKISKTLGSGACTA